MSNATTLDLSKLTPDSVINRVCGSGISGYVRKMLALTVSKVLAAGPVPNHLGIVMDGNRRYAQEFGLPATKGHSSGIVTLLFILKACRLTGIRNISIFAYSMDNFRRSRSESQEFFDLARNTATDLVKNQAKFMNEMEIKVRFVGLLDMFDEKIREQMDTLEELTRDNTKLTLNVCVGYSSRLDMAMAMHSFVQEAADGTLKEPEREITIETFADHLGSVGSGPVDVLIRTSGETRLSDFMCWEVCSGARIFFTDVLWPAFTMWELYKIIFTWGYCKSVEELDKKPGVTELSRAPPLFSVSQAQSSVENILESRFGTHIPSRRTGKSAGPHSGVPMSADAQGAGAGAGAGEGPGAGGGSSKTPAPPSVASGSDIGSPKAPLGELDTNSVLSQKAPKRLARKTAQTDVVWIPQDGQSNAKTESSESN